MGQNTSILDPYRVGARPKSVPLAATRYRLAFAIHKYFEFGGLERELRRLAVACAERGHEVHILTTAWEGPVPEGIHLHLLSLRARTNHQRSREFADVVRAFANREAFDCLIGFNKMPGLDVYWGGDPCLAEHLRRNKPRFMRWLPRYKTYLELEAGVFGKSCDTEVLLLAEPEKEHIVQHYGASESRLHLLPPGIDRRRFESKPNDRSVRSALRNEFGIGESDLMMLMVGSSFERKGVGRALQAMASLQEPERSRRWLVVVGNDDPAPFRRLAGRLKVANRTLFTGGREDVLSFYRSADIFLHPARQETGGYVLLEAMLCGVPQLVTETCGYACHVKRAKAGLVCPEPFRQETLNRLLAQMLSVEARNTWKRNAAGYCSVTDLYSMVETMIDVIVRRAARNRRAA